MTKKVCKQRNMFYSAITKNLNWEILTKLELSLKDEMGLRMKKINIMGVHEKPICKRELPQKGGFRHFTNLWRDTSKRGSGVFEGGVQRFIPQ